eukprot:scaffold69917_cov59-Attheya_sp.AAC.1
MSSMILLFFGTEQNRENPEPLYWHSEVFLGRNGATNGNHWKLRARPCTAVHGAKKYENADINDKNKNSYLPYHNYPRVPFESSRVNAGTGEVSGAGGAQRVRSVLSKSHAQRIHGTKKK